MIKTKIITIKDGENELRFKIRQMSAADMENWVLRVIQLAASADFGDLSHEDKSQGIESVISAIVKNPMKFIASVDYAKFKPLWDELLKCCSKVDDRVEQQCDIESVGAYVSSFVTLVRLRVEVLNLNFGFFSGESPSESPQRGVTIKAEKSKQN